MLRCVGLLFLLAFVHSKPSSRLSRRHSVAPSAGRRRLSCLTCEQVKLPANDAARNDHFGWSVAIDGDTVVVGAYGDGSKSGSAYLFLTTDGGATYGQVAKLTAADAAAGDEFGRSVAISGDAVAISGGGSV